MLVNQNNHKLINVIEKYLFDANYTSRDLSEFENLHIEFVKQLFSGIYL